MKPSINLLITLLLILSPLGQTAAQDDPTQEPFMVVSSTGNTKVQVPLFMSQIIRLSSPVKRISVGNPEIGDLLIISSRQIYIVGKSLGTTNVVLWDRSDQVIGTLNLEVTHDKNSLKEKLHELLPGEVIEVHSSNGSIVLSGEVSSAAKADIAVKLAETFLKKSKDSDDTLQGTVLSMYRSPRLHTPC
jgi:pilus assembly protein CpaC